MYENINSSLSNLPFHALLNNEGSNSFWSSVQIRFCIHNLQTKPCKEGVYTSFNKIRCATWNIHSMYWSSSDETNATQGIQLCEKHPLHLALLRASTFCAKIASCFDAKKEELANVFAVGPFVHHILLPFKIYPPWVRSALHLMLTTSDPAVSFEKNYQRQL